MKNRVHQPEYSSPNDLWPWLWT